MHWALHTCPRLKGLAAARSWFHTCANQHWKHKTQHSRPKRSMQQGCRNTAGNGTHRWCPAGISTSCDKLWTATTCSSTQRDSASGLTAPWFAHTRSYHHGAQSTPDCTVLHTSDKLLLVTTGRLIWLLPWRRAAAWCSGLCTLQVIGKQAQGLRLASGRQGAAGSSPERAIVAACTMLHCQYARQIYHTQCLEAVTARSQEDAHQQRTLDGARHSLRQDGWKQLLQVRTRGASDLLM